jgi:hypothetical protein
MQRLCSPCVPSESRYEKFPQNAVRGSDMLQSAPTIGSGACLKDEVHPGLERIVGAER